MVWEKEKKITTSTTAPKASPQLSYFIKQNGSKAEPFEIPR